MVKIRIISSGINNNTNILLLNCSKVKNSLLTHPWIKDVKIKRKYPNGLNINIEEYKPLAVVNAGQKFIVDGEGVIFKEYNEQDLKIPIIKGLSYADLNLSYEEPKKYFKKILNILQYKIYSADIFSNDNIYRISSDRKLGIVVDAFKKNKIIKLGNKKYLEKIKNLNKTISYLKDIERFSSIESIDLTNVNRVVVSQYSL